MKLLLIVPHPDDEVYGASGTMMKYLANGEHCGLVTLTRGEAGRTLGLCDTPEELADLRGQELKDCLEIIGVSVHEQYQFPDKRLNEWPLEELTEVVREAIFRYRPETVLTFPPNGANGHPDHVTTHLAVKAAWDSLLPNQRPNLWYYASTQEPEDEALKAGWFPPNVFHDVSAYLNRKLEAIACHRTQALSTVDFIRRVPERIATESFHHVKPSQ